MATKKDYAIGIDIGGTTTKFGIVNDHGEILEQDRIPSNEHEVVEDFIEDLYKKLMPMIEKSGGVKNFAGIGIGAPNGNIYTGTIEYAPNLKWKGIIPLAELIQKKFGLQAKLTNDANAAAMAEMMYGACKNMRHFITILLVISLSWVTTGYACQMDGMQQLRKACCCPHGEARETSATDQPLVSTADEGEPCCVAVVNTAMDDHQPGVAAKATALDLPTFTVLPVSEWTIAEPDLRQVSTPPPARGPPAASGTRTYLTTARLRL